MGLFGGGGGGIDDCGIRGLPGCCCRGGGGGGRHIGGWPPIPIGGGRGLGGAWPACGGGGGIFGGAGLNCWTWGCIIGGGIVWPGCCGWTCQGGCPATGIGGNAAPWGGGGGRNAGIGPGATVPFAKGRGGMVPLDWGTFESVGGPLANKVWGLLFWAVGLLAAKTLSAI